MVLIWYPKCSTCQKAKKYLEGNHCDVTYRDIVTDTPTSLEIQELIRLSGKDISKFFNTSGLKYRSMDLKNKLPYMSDMEKLEILASDGMLIKRPILVTDEKVYIGFNEKEWSEVL